MSINNNFSILFRGDGRKDVTEFKSKDMETPINAIDNYQQDIKPNIAVCLTPIFDLAACYPVAYSKEGLEELSLKMMNSKMPEFRCYPKVSTIYITRIPTERLSLTYLEQIKYGHEIAYIQEVAVKEVSPEEIIGKISIKRFFYSYSETEVTPPFSLTLFRFGGEYKLLDNEVTYNPAVMNEPWFVEVKDKIDTLIQERLNSAIQIPIVGDLGDNNQTMYSLETQPKVKTVPLSLHKVHKRLTQAHFLIECLSGMDHFYKDNPPFDRQKIIERVLKKSKDITTTPFPTVKLLKHSEKKKVCKIVKDETTTLQKVCSDVSLLFEADPMR